MAIEGRGRLFRRKDGKYLIYLPIDLAENSVFPFKDYDRTKKGTEVVAVKVSFRIGDDKLIIERWKEPERQEL